MSTSKPATPTYVTLVSGSIAAIGSTFSKQPLDRLKWLRQVSEGNSNITQSSYWNVFRSILQSEGIPGLFKGVSAAISRNIPHAALVYTIFPKIRNLMIDNLSYNMNDSFINTLSGSLSSIIVTCITHPGDTLRVRYTVQYSQLSYNSYRELLSSLRFEGYKSFYRGLIVSCIGTTFRGGVGFGIYETLKSEDVKKWQSDIHPYFQRFGIGFIAGGASTIASYPADTIRRRMQVWNVHRTLNNIEQQQFGSNISMEKNYKNARTLFIHILKNEGFKGYFKGLSVTMIKTPISTSVSLAFNDIAKKLIFGINA